MSSEELTMSKDFLIALLLQESVRGYEWGPLTEKGARDIVERLDEGSYCSTEGTRKCIR